MNEKFALLAVGQRLMALLLAAVDGKPWAGASTCKDWERLYRLAHFHHVAGAAWFGVEASGISLPESIARPWREERDLGVVREIRFDVEREGLYDALEHEEIAYMPLKGIVMKTFYPQVGMRWMSDHDILYHPEDQQRLIGVMTALGYTTKSLSGTHDVFQKPPIFNFEMHRALLPETNAYAFYFNGIWERALPDATGWGFTMTQEDFYLYHLLHFHKHLTGGGSGVRGLLDLYLLRKQSEIHWPLIDKALEELNLLGWHTDLLSLLDALMSGQNLGEDETDLFIYILRSGTYGTRANRIENSLRAMDAALPHSRKNKGSYIRCRLFPNPDFMVVWWPLLEDYPFLLPLGYGWRLVRAVPKLAGCLGELAMVWRMK